ncbi:MAG: hypothetical protein RMK29_12750 [Myxococcales bacterium]|nr:hypothetical protein [Myxococcota bacterium]MDW8282574.1 hypothetical protein [Myxococcales bacterium]
MRAAVLVLVLLAARPAGADRSFDLALLHPTVDAYGLIAVERAETPRRWEVNAQLLLGYAHRPLHLRLALADRMGTFESDLVRGQLTVDLGLALGLWDFLAVAALLPAAVQWYDGAALGERVVPMLPTMALPTPPTMATGLYRGEPRQNVGLSGAGPRDPRISLKARLWRRPQVGVAVLLSATVPLGNAHSFLGDRFATLRPALIADAHLLGRVSLAANIGATLRQTSQLHDPVSGVVLLEVGHELNVALGGSVRVHRLIALGLELFGAAPLIGASPSEPQPGDVSPPTSVSPHIDLVGAAYLHPVESLRLALAVGGGLIAAAPRQDVVRVVMGLSWSPAPRPGGLP